VTEVPFLDAAKNRELPSAATENVVLRPFLANVESSANWKNISSVLAMRPNWKALNGDVHPALRYGTQRKVE
jgi:hypothetical protein